VLKLSIVIPVYNAAPFLDTLLSSFLASFLAIEGNPACELVAINDGSTDGSAEILSRWASSGQLPLQVLTTSGIGPGPARELGAQAARSEWVALVDADERFSPGWLRAALAFVQNPGQAMGCEGRIEICDRHHLSLFSHQTQSLEPGRYLTANLILKRSLVKFYPSYGRRFYFREDSDLAFQLLDSGYKIAYSPELLLYHPPLIGQWWRPIRLALRYQYDGLLARRFPQRYWQEVDAHRLLGVQFPLFRLVIYLGCWLIQGLALALLLLGWHQPIYRYLAVLILGASGAIALAPVFVYLPIKQITPWHLPLALGIYLVVPWVAIAAWLYGFWRHRHERPYGAAYPAVK
jgi:glycosyltransferase involved in cell wall biosynthesis